jgi:hypothetical protein
LNLRYSNEFGYNIALISHFGQSFTIPINPNFRIVAIIEESEFKKLPPPFLNRFEKLYFDFNINNETINTFNSTFEKVQFSFSEFALFDSQSKSQYLEAIRQISVEIWDPSTTSISLTFSIFMLSNHPSTILFIFLIMVFSNLFIHFSSNFALFVSQFLI